MIPFEKKTKDQLTERQSQVLPSAETDDNKTVGGKAGYCTINCCDV